MDSPLTEQGQRQALAVGKLLGSLSKSPDDFRVVCSPLGRARETAALILGRLNAPAGTLTMDDLLRELSYGAWAGLTLDEVERRFPGAQAARRAAHWTYRVPGGESYADGAARARAWLERQNDPTNTVVVTHEMMSRCLQKAYLGLDPATALERKHPHLVVVELGEATSLEHRAVFGGSA